MKKRNSFTKNKNKKQYRSKTMRLKKILKMPINNINYESNNNTSKKITQLIVPESEIIESTLKKVTRNKYNNNTNKESIEEIKYINSNKNLSNSNKNTSNKNSSNSNKNTNKNTNRNSNSNNIKLSFNNTKISL